MIPLINFAILLAAVLFTPLRAELPGWIDLLPDPSLKGWTRIPIPAISGVNPNQQWRVDTEQRTLICTGEGGHEWLRCDRDFGDFILQADWRFTPRAPEEKKYNSGIGVRLTRFGDIWHQAQTGPTGGFLFGETLIDGAMKRFHLLKEMKENRVKPAGEWNTYEIRVQGDIISLSVNGAIVSRIAGIAIRRGYVALEAEGFEIAFRNIRIKPLE